MVTVVGFFFIIFLFAAVVALVWGIKKALSFVDKSYCHEAIISFFLPLVGMIIYAINVEKNKKLANSCIAPVLLLMVISVILVIAVNCLIFFL